VKQDLRLCDLKNVYVISALLHILDCVCCGVYCVPLLCAGLDTCVLFSRAFVSLGSKTEKYFLFHFHCEYFVAVFLVKLAVSLKLCGMMMCVQ
jgi:hypothetical protein